MRTAAVCIVSIICHQHNATCRAAATATAVYSFQHRNMTYRHCMQSQQNEIIILVINSNNSATLADKSAACEYSWRVRLRAFEIPLMCAIRARCNTRQLHTRRINCKTGCTCSAFNTAVLGLARLDSCPRLVPRRSLAFPVRPHRRAIVFQHDVATNNCTAAGGPSLIA